MFRVAADEREREGGFGFWVYRAYRVYRVYRVLGLGFWV